MGTSNFSVQVTDSAGGKAAKSFAITIVAGQTITTDGTLPNGEVSVPYSQTLAVSGGVAPYTWSKTTGTFPLGLTISGGGVLSGTPTSAVLNSSLTIKVTDSQGGTAAKGFTLTIAAAPSITSVSPLPSGEASLAYSQIMTVSGGVTP